MSDDHAETHPLTTERGLNLFVGLLMHTGAMCPKCGYGTRKTSKNWAKCKRCGERVARQPFPEIAGPPCGCGDPTAPGIDHRQGQSCYVLPTFSNDSDQKR